MPSVFDSYQILERIGAGGLGVVYRVQDRASGQIKAMKIMPRARGSANLRSEFLALARLHHDNIVSVFDYGLTDSGHDFFTMEHVEGPPLLEAVAKVPSPAFYQLVAGVLRALAFVHARGIVHADIKPSNILIDGAMLERDPSLAARLVDFGLAAAIDDPTSSSARGTFPYAAPEVYAGRLDARSDLYALGVVLYQLLTGVQPFSGASARDVLVAQRRGPPVDPRTHREDLPAALVELVLALCDPAPGARPQTADEVLGRINEIASTHFTIAEARPLMDPTGVLVGRERDLADLQRRWHEAAAGRGGVVLLTGEEGIGKSRLMSELKLYVQLDGGHAFAADVAARRDAPYAGIAELVRGVLAALGGRPSAVTGEWRRTLTPLLGGRAEAPQGDESSRFALAEAVTGVILDLGADQPTVLTVDNVHLADAATVDLLAYLARSVADSQVLLVMAGRDGGFAASGQPASGTDQLAAAVRGALRGGCIALPPIDRQSVFTLTEQAFGREIARRLGDDLYRVSSGNPSHAARALELLLAEGVVVRERGQWLLKDESPTIPLPTDARASALARAAALPAPSRDALLTASVLGESFSGNVLSELCRDQVDVDTAMAEAAAAHIVLADATTGTFRFFHRGVCEALYEELPAERRVELHRGAAQILEARHAIGESIAPGALASHYLAMGDARAVEWGLLAAAEHAGSYDHHGALQWYLRIRPLVAERDTAAHVDERLGDLRATVGDVDAAHDDYRRALDALADRPADHIRLSRRLGELERRRGNGDAALSILMSALAEAREHKLTEQEAQCHLRIGWVLWYRAEYKAAMEHAVAGHVLARAGGDRATGAELERLRAAIDISLSDYAAAVAHLEVGLADAEAIGDERLVAGLLHEMGRACIHSGDYARAIEALEKAIPTNESVGHIEEAAKSLNNLGCACYYQGDWERARRSWERFRRLCERLDEHSELVNALNNLGQLYREMGYFTEALAALDRAAQVAGMTGHAHMAAMVAGNRGETLFRQGDLVGARECYQRAQLEFSRMQARADIIETKRRVCELDIACGKFNEALDRAVDTAREAKDTGAKLEEGILHRVIAQALRLQGDSKSATWFLERAREILTTMGARYERARLDLEASELAAAQGRPDDADRYLNAAIEAFAALGARWDLGRARARKRAPQAAGAASVGQVDLDLLLELGQAAANVELERLLELALDKILARTNFERGFILLLDQDSRPRERLRRVREGSPGFARDDAEFSGTIVRQVAASGQALSVSDISEADDLREQKSVVALGLRQIMCVPMRAHGRVIGIIYIDSRRLSFEEQAVDLSILEAFAAQVALAIENARLVAEEKRKGELMAILAHEIRNPLAGIIGYSDIGENEPDSMGFAPKELFARIRRDADRLKRLVDNVLELARHESGNIDWSMLPFDISELVGEVAATYGPLCESRTIGLETCTTGLNGPALGNPDRVMQVLSNLVGNAVKFTPPGGTIRISAQRETVRATDPKAPPIPATEIGAWTPTEVADDVVADFIRVDVADTGPGMSEELRARLFEKFAQGGSQSRSGVGLGLYISREIIARHGGTIWVDSEPSKGSIFSFRIPVA